MRRQRQKASASAPPSLLMDSHSRRLQKGSDCVRDLHCACALHAGALAVFSESTTGRVATTGWSFFVTVVSHWPGFHLDMTPTFREKSKRIRRIPVKQLGTKSLLVFFGSIDRINALQRWLSLHFESIHSSKNGSRESRMMEWFGASADWHESWDFWWMQFFFICPFFSPVP